MSLARWLLLACLGCGGGATPSTAPPPTLPACIPVVPLRFLVLEHGTAWEPRTELLADGTVIRSRDRAPIARIEAEHVRGTAGDIFVCDHDELHVAGQHSGARFEPSGDLYDGRVRIHVSDTGEVSTSMGGAPAVIVGRVDGPTRSPRTAAVIVMLTLFSANAGWTF